MPMQVQKKMEANASKRLKVPDGKKPGDELERFGKFLTVETHRLRISHRAGGGGRKVCEGRAAMVDVLLRSIIEAVENPLPEEALEHPPFALVAYGGYGRGELNPWSDVDIMFLHDGRLMPRGRPHPYLGALLDVGGLLYTLYDLDLKIAHAVRSIAECIELANSDMKSKTSLIEARLIFGDEELFEKFQTTLFDKCVKGKESAYISERVEDQNARRTKFGDSPCMQEPNIKNGCGGLRDYQNLFWMAWFKYQARTPQELVGQDVLSQPEARRLREAYDFLLRVRNELHYHTGRATDELTKSVQPSIALNLGYTDRSPSRRIEKFMRDYYLHARNIYLISRTVEQRLALLPKPSRLPAFRRFIMRSREENRQVVDGFRFENGYIVQDSQRVFREQPRRMMRVFLYAQRRGLALHPDLEHLIRSQLPLVDSSFKADRHVHETFLEILDQPGNVSRILRAMHEVDLLGKFIPEFGRMTCLVQHEFFHQYAADEHTLMCLEALDKVWGANEKPYQGYTEFLINLSRPNVLYLALLLHDVGKGMGKGKHAEVGGQIARQVGCRIGLNPGNVELLKFLVDCHLVMVQVSQTRDLDDPDVIRAFAGTVKNEETLTLLLLLTFADSMGTSKKLWNDFKDSLLLGLFFRARKLLSDDTAFIRAEAKEKERLAGEVAELAPASFEMDEIRAHFEDLPRRYLQTHTPRQILADISLAHRFMHLQVASESRSLEPVVDWHNEPDRGYSVAKVCTWDRQGLFVKISGSLAAAGLNILSAQIISRPDGVIIDTFFVTDADTGKLAKREQKQSFEEILTNSLSLQVEVDFARTIVNRPFSPPLYQGLAGERIPTTCRFDNDTSADYTILDVVTEDRVGLLHFVANALTELSFDIHVAKITTEKGAVIDSFYITDWTGRKVTDPKDQEHLDRKIRMAIRRLDRRLKRRRAKAAAKSGVTAPGPA